MSKLKIDRYTSPNSVDQNERIEHDLNQLGLEGMLPYFRNLADENIRSHKTPKDYLEELLNKQRVHKENNRILSRVLQAGFGKAQTLEDFNWKVKVNYDQRQIFDLASCTFIRENKNIVFLGPGGIGKTHLAKALGKKAVDQGFSVKFIELDKLIDKLLFKYKDVDSQQRFFDSLLRPKLLILDEIRYRETNPYIQDFIYRLINQRYDQGSTIFTSNFDFDVWEKLFGELARAALERIRDKKYQVLINVEGESYRLGNNRVKPVEETKITATDGSVHPTIS